MDRTTIQIPLEADIATLYNTASAEDQQKMQAIISLWLREMTTSGKSLSDIMDKLSDSAAARGLTPDILESLLNDGE